MNVLFLLHMGVNVRKSLIVGWIEGMVPDEWSSKDNRLSIDTSQPKDVREAQCFLLGLRECSGIKWIHCIHSQSVFCCSHAETVSIRNPFSVAVMRKL